MGETAKPADYFFKEAEACRLLFLGGQKTTKIKALVPPLVEITYGMVILLSNIFANLAIGIW